MQDIWNKDLVDNLRGAKLVQTVEESEMSANDTFVNKID